MANQEGDSCGRNHDLNQPLLGDNVNSSILASGSALSLQEEPSVQELVDDASAAQDVLPEVSSGVATLHRRPVGHASILVLDDSTAEEGINPQVQRRFASDMEWSTRLLVVCGVVVCMDGLLLLNLRDPSLECCKDDSKAKLDWNGLVDLLDSIYLLLMLLLVVTAAR